MMRSILMMCLGLAIVVSSCKNGQKSTEEVKKTDPGAEGYVKGTMADQSGLDGCGWIITLDDANAESKIKAINPVDDLPAEFKSDGKTVWVKFTPSDMMSTCMKGQMAKVEGIKSR